jgi:hypothetical protein
MPEPATVIVATDGSVAAARIDRVDVYQAPAPVPGVSWPVLVGQVPVLASAFQDRAGLRERIETARSGAGVWC